MRISDWSSDVCSSDLSPTAAGLAAGVAGVLARRAGDDHADRPCQCDRDLFHLAFHPAGAAVASDDGGLSGRQQFPERCRAIQEDPRAIRSLTYAHRKHIGEDMSVIVGVDISHLPITTKT